MIFFRIMQNRTYLNNGIIIPTVQLYFMITILNLNLVNSLEFLSILIVFIYIHFIVHIVTILYNYL